MRDDCQYVIMAKAPVLGRVKTRLTPYYSPAEAMQWHQRMCHAVIHQTTRLFQHVVLATDDTKHPFWQDFGIPLMDQGTGDLGQRLDHVMQQQVASCWRPLLFLGTDSPHMPDARLLAAADALHHHDVVIGPVEDGGYNLIGMASPVAGLFDHTDWGTPRVYAQTMARMQGYRVHTLSMHYDIDTADDLLRLLNSGFELDALY